jgi:hypothetical protein
MNVKEMLLSLFQQDIERSTGYVRQDLDVVRELIARTKAKETQQEFMAEVRATWTLGERDSYLRATEWKRRQTRIAA